MRVLFELSRHRRGNRIAAAAILTVVAIIGFALVDGHRWLLGHLPGTWRIWLVAAKHGVTVDHGLSMTMADGTRLAASLYRPRGTHERAPTILIRTPYRRLQHDTSFQNAIHFAANGYAAVVQDLRGTGASGGELLPWTYAAADAGATMDWITRQSWSNGKIATFGCSALGETQLVAEDRAPPAWRAMIVQGAGGAVGSLAGRYAYFGLFEGGVFQLASGFGWFVASGTKRPDAPPAESFDHARHLRALPVSSLVARVRPAANGYDAYLTTPLTDRRWAEWGFLGDDSRLRVPALVLNSWGDQTLEDTLALAEHWRKADPEGTQGRQKVIVAAGDHCDHEDVGKTGRFGELVVTNAYRPYRQYYLRWFDYWLRGKGDALAELPAYTYYVMGAGSWREADSWPPPEARIERYYLASLGSANSRFGTGQLSRDRSLRAVSDTWRYDPADPTPSRGGPLCCSGNPDDRSGPAEQVDVEKRADVLVYTSEVLAEDLWIAGPIRAHLTVSSDAKDTDIVGRLVHVWPDGRATSIQEGALRLRYRNGVERPELLEPGKPVRAVVDMRSVAYRLPKGHKLRLQITSSAFPRLERNLNTGRDNATETEIVVATNKVHYDLDGGSWLALPVLPRQ